MKSLFQDALLPMYSDEELLQLIFCSQEVEPDSIFYRMRLLSDKLIAVSGTTTISINLRDTLKAMEVARHLGIRVPQVLRTVSAAPRNLYFIIMERVDGITLEEAWPDLSWITTVKLALQLRRFVSIMRSQTSPTAGALVTGRCTSSFLQDCYGLPVRSTPSDMWSYIEFWAGIGSSPQKAIGALLSGERISTKKGVPPMPSTFVLTHHRLLARNIFVDKRNQLWIVGWQYAGWYPKFFEYAGMQNLLLENWNWFARLRWKVFSWIAAGRSERERKLLKRIRNTAVNFYALRRIEIVRYGAPSERPVSPSESEEDES